MLTFLMITVADVRDVALGLPRTEEHLIRDYVKFRVGKIVYASVSPDDLGSADKCPPSDRKIGSKLLEH